MAQLTRGKLVPERFAGTVASVHDAAVNIALRDRRGAYFVSLTRDRGDWTELSIAVPHAMWPVITTATRSEGTTVPVLLTAEGVLVVGNAETSFPVERGPTPPRPSPTTRPSTRTISTARDRLLIDHGTIGFVALLIDPASSEHSRRFDDDPFVHRAVATLYGGSTPRSRAIARLVGLGGGFTPSGDDFVSGVLAAEILLGTRLVDHDEVERALSKTTAGGASLLRVALAGYPPTYQLRIVDALATGRVAEAIRIARSHGHSSGLDALTGLLWGLQVRPRDDTVPSV